jgi:hypothetical protein
MSIKTSLVILAVVLSTVAVTAIGSNMTFAKITEVPTGSENPAGKAAPGQQPEAQGQGQTQFSENQNPAGSAPPGQNK